MMDTNPNFIPGLYNPIPQTQGPGFGANDLQASFIDPNAPNARMGQYGAWADQAAGNLFNGPDRFALAQEKWDQYQAASDPVYQDAIRRATQSAAANGRLGSGMLTTSYGDLALQRSRDLDIARRGYLSDALEGSIQDRLNNAQMAASLEGQQYGYGQQNRNELRTERQYQSSAQQQAIDNALKQRLVEEDLQNSSFNRDNTWLQTLIQLGYLGDPAGLSVGASGQMTGDANAYNQMVANLMNQYYYGRGMTGSGG